MYCAQASSISITNFSSSSGVSSLTSVLVKVTIIGRGLSVPNTVTEVGSMVMQSVSGGVVVVVVVVLISSEHCI